MGLIKDNYYIRFKVYKQQIKQKPKEIFTETIITEENSSNYPGKNIGDIITNLTKDENTLIKSRIIYINLEVYDKNNIVEDKKQNTDITLSIPYSPTISETEIYNELKKQKIYIKGLFGEQSEIDLTNSEDVFEEEQPEL